MIHGYCTGRLLMESLREIGGKTELVNGIDEPVKSEEANGNVLIVNKVKYFGRFKGSYNICVGRNLSNFKR